MVSLSQAWSASLSYTSRVSLVSLLRRWTTATPRGFCIEISSAQTFSSTTSEYSVHACACTFSVSWSCDCMWYQSCTYMYSTMSCITMYTVCVHVHVHVHVHVCPTCYIHVCTCSFITTHVHVYVLCLPVYMCMHVFVSLSVCVCVCVCVCVASVVYLISCSITYYRGQLKLGDFGLARLYHADDKR